MDAPVDGVALRLEHVVEAGFDQLAIAVEERAARGAARERVVTEIHRARLTGIRVAVSVEALEARLAGAARRRDGRARPDRGPLRRGARGRRAALCAGPGARREHDSVARRTGGPHCAAGPCWPPTREGVPPVRWTDPVLTVGVAPVKRVHLTELRAALDAVYDAAREATTVVHGQHRNGGG